MEKKKYAILIIVLFLLGYLVFPTIVLLVAEILKQEGRPVDGYTTLLVPYIPTMLTFSLILRFFRSGFKAETASGKGFFRTGLFAIAFVLMMVFQLATLLVPSSLKGKNSLDTMTLLYSAAIAITAIPAQTLFEEMLFRVLPLRLASGGGLGRGKSSIIALLCSSVLFTLMHMNNPEVSEYGTILALYYFASAMMLGIFMMLSDGIEISWAYHLAINLYGAVIASAEGGVLQNRTFFILESNHAVAQSFISLILSSLLMLYLICKGKKNNLFSL